MQRPIVKDQIIHPNKFHFATPINSATPISTPGATRAMLYVVVCQHKSVVRHPQNHDADILIMTTNFRRSAANSVGTVSLKPTSPHHNAALRKQMTFTASELRQLALFQTDEVPSRDQRDIYTVFRCVQDTSRASKVSIEADVPMGNLFATDIIGLDRIKLDGSAFYIPVLGSHKWAPEHYPQFDTWLFASTRYPTYAVDGKTIVPGFNHSSVRKTSTIDRFETVIAILQNTLLKFMSTDDPKFARLAWQLFHTAESILKSDVREPRPGEKGELAQLIKDRDSSITVATKFKEFVDAHTPSHFYALMRNLMITTPEIVHKTRLPSPDLTIWGVCVTETLKKSSVRSGSDRTGSDEKLNENLDARKLDEQHFDEAVLRVYLERGLRRVALPNDPMITDLNELVTWCHTKMDTRLQSVLKYGSLTYHFAKFFGANPSVTVQGIVDFVRNLKATVGSFDGIMPFCLSICPTTTLTDQSMAEIWMAACECKDKTAVLDVNALSDPTPHRLNAMIKRANDAIKRVHDSAAQSVASVASVASVESNHASRDARSIARKLNCDLKEFMKSPDERTRFLSNINALCASGTLENVDVLTEWMKISPLSDRRFKTMICRSAPADSPLFDHFSDDAKTRGTLCGSNWCVQFYVRLGKKVIAPPEPEPEVESAVPYAIYIPFNHARQMVDGLSVLKKKVETECHICFEPGRTMVVLHGDARHVVCSQCRPNIRDCPFCREVLSE